MVIAVTTVIFGSLFFGFLMYLDSIPRNKYHEAPNISNQEYLKTYSQRSAGGISLLWSYEHFHAISSPTLSADGTLIFFIGTIDEQPALVCLNNKGERLWVNKNIASHPKYSIWPRILVVGKYILLYLQRADAEGEPIAKTLEGNIRLYNTKGDLIWSKTIWGKPVLLPFSDELLVSRYIKMLYEGDKELDSPTACVDPEVVSLGGGDSFGFDVYGQVVSIDIPTGHERELDIVSVDSVSVRGNFLLSSCIGKTTLFNSRFERINTFKEYGFARLAPDERYLAIRSHTNNSEKDILHVRDIKGGLLWSQEIDRFYPPYLENNPREDHGLIPFSKGRLGVMTSRTTSEEPYVTDLTFTAYGPHGNLLWTKKKIENYNLRMIKVPNLAENIIVLTEAEKKVEVKWWLNSKLNEIFERLDLFGMKDFRPVFRLYRLGFDGEVSGKSQDIISLGDVRVLVTSQDGNYLLAATRHKMYYFRANQ